MSNLTTLTPTAEAVTVQLPTPVTPTTPVAASVDPGCIFESKETLVKYLQGHPVINVTTFFKTEVAETYLRSFTVCAVADCLPSGHCGVYVLVEF